MREHRILIVNNDEQLCEWLKRIFLSWKITAKSIADPLLVTDKIKKSFYHLLLLDIAMLEVSGRDVLAEVSELCPETKIIMIGPADKKTATATLQLDAFDFLEKPITMDVLFRTVKRALEVQKIELKHKKILEEIGDIQEALLTRTLQLERLNRELVHINKALSTLVGDIKKIEDEKEEQIFLKIRSLIIPIIEKLRQDKNMRRYEPQFAILEDYIADLASDLVTSLQVITSLSLSEARIASMIRHGMTSAEVATHLHISPETVKTHRRNIRRKLQIVGEKSNLMAYLHSLESHVSTANSSEIFDLKEKT